MKKSSKKNKQKTSAKPNLLPFIFSPVYNGYKPGLTFSKPLKSTEQSNSANNRQILIEFTPDNYIDSLNTEVNILITPVIPK